MMKKKNILIIGNLGYIGPELVKYLRINHDSFNLIGYDIGFFMKCYTTTTIAPEIRLDYQYYGDVRNFNESILDNIDSVIYLAAISNDPIGNKFEQPTLEINYKSAIEIAKIAKIKKVKNFVFASSCSVYGINQGFPKTETDDLNPLTPYAKSKIFAELDLEEIADKNFSITCLRFATACGMSDRLRLDLVLNDFVASALVSNKIEILSDGTPYRPLINVQDMARAISWAMFRNEGDFFETLNIGSDEWNFQIKDLAFAIKDIFGDLDVEIDPNALVDKRSYQVSFKKFAEMAPNHVPIYDLERTIKELITGLRSINFNDLNFRQSHLIRLNIINELIRNKIIDNNLTLK
jgi:nucleoside-diphosphate-sugar epimerase